MKFDQTILSLKNRGAIVTGVSRGTDKGIAIELSLQRAKVYITGRSGNIISLNDNLQSDLMNTLNLINDIGGKEIVVQMMQIY